MDVQSDRSRLETPRRLEILTGGGRRRWSAAQKAKIVADRYADDALPIVEIARRYRARGSQVHGWRKHAREGQLVLPANTEMLNCAPVGVLRATGLRLCVAAAWSVCTNLIWNGWRAPIQPARILHVISARTRQFICRFPGSGRVVRKRTLVLLQDLSSCARVICSL